MTDVQEASSQATLQIPGDVDASTGNVESASDIVIAGTVRESLRVKSGGNVTVQGSIEASAVVEAVGNVVIAGGVTTHGQVTAGGNIHTKYCDEARLNAGGDIVVAGGGINSELHAGGRLLVEQGALVGGRAYARQGAAIKVLGNENQLKTQLAIGVEPDVLAETRRAAKDLKKQQETSARIRETVQPLLAQLKRLNPQQRERATELMYEADSIDARVRDELNRQAQVLAANSPSGPVELAVTEKVFPKVSLVFADKMTTFPMERQGPFKVSRQHVDRVEEIILAEPTTDVTATLVSHEYEPTPALTAGVTKAQGLMSKEVPIPNA